MKTKKGWFSTTNYLHKTNKMKSISTMGTDVSVGGKDEEEKRAIEMFQAREEEIQKQKMQIKEKVEFQLCRAEEETRRLARIWEVSP